MAIEAGRFLSDLLRELPQDHPDRAHLEGMLTVNSAYQDRHYLGQERDFSPVWDTTIEAFNRKIEDPEYEQPSFGEVATALRKKYGFKQRAIAERIGVTPTHWNKVERGNRPAPEAHRVIALAQNLRLVPEDAVTLIHSAGYTPRILRSLQLNQYGLLYPPQNQQATQKSI